MENKVYKAVSNYMESTGFKVIEKKCEFDMVTIDETTGELLLLEVNWAMGELPDENLTREKMRDFEARAIRYLSRARMDDAPVFFGIISAALLDGENAVMIRCHKGITPIEIEARAL